jgi:hypothetical protein
MFCMREKLGGEINTLNQISVKSVDCRENVLDIDILMLSTVIPRQYSRKCDFIRNF